MTAPDAASFTVARIRLPRLVDRIRAKAGQRVCLGTACQPALFTVDTSQLHVDFTQLAGTQGPTTTTREVRCRWCLNHVGD